jgi:hypothetical protein
MGPPMDPPSPPPNEGEAKPLGVPMLPMPPMGTMPDPAGYSPEVS